MSPVHTMAPIFDAPGEKARLIEKYRSVELNASCPSICESDQSVKVK